MIENHRENDDEDSRMYEESQREPPPFLKEQELKAV